MVKRDRDRVWYGSNSPAEEPHKPQPAAQGITRHAQVGVGETMKAPAKKARRETSSAQEEARRLATQTSLSGNVDRTQGDHDQQAMRQPTDPRSTKCNCGTEKTPPLFRVRAPGSAISPRSPVRTAGNLLQLEPGMESSPVMMVGLPLGGMIEQAHAYRDDAVTRKEL
ncbi:hypothetical protein LTS09_016575 [Friedmanniomyces endolithicus]|nr:hypothetical protein LTS09_016575 [Friedmanniomyces endolithicus]